MKNNQSQKFRVFRPSAGVVSNHRTMNGALKSLKRQIDGSKKQGGYCNDYIEIFDGATWRATEDKPQ